MKAIETEYAGCRFRSRLEARWAVFFDVAGIEWKYEDEGYEIRYDHYRDEYQERWYLPDFYLPGLDFHVEVKGAEEALDKSFLAEAGFALGSMLILGPIPKPVKDACFEWALIEKHPRGASCSFCTAGAEYCDGCGASRVKNHACFCFINYHRWGFSEKDSGVRSTGAHSGLWLKPRVARLGGVAPDFITMSHAYAAARGARFEHGELGARP